MAAYQPSKKVKDEAKNNREFIPVTYIQRKPHPNGLLIYIAASFVIIENKKKLFIVDFEHHLSSLDVTPTNVIQKFMKDIV